jgi:Tfp pilus assembly protein PilF
MKYLIKKVYIILFFTFIVLNQNKAFTKNNDNLYNSKNISNYFLGIVSANFNKNDNALDYLKKVELLKKKHSEYNIQYLRSLILSNKFDEATIFSKSIWNEGELFFEADLLIGLDYFINKDYENAEKHFQRLNEISRYNLFFDDFIGNILIAWIKASQENKNEAYKFLNKIPDRYYHIKKTQDVFLKCFFDSQETPKIFEEIVQNEEYDFARYNFFMVNYFLFKNENEKAKEAIKKSSEKYSSNLLIKETENFLFENKESKIKDFFNCKNPKGPIAEFFYVISNLYSSEKEYQISNFYFNVSQYLNKDFLSNNALLAENYYFQKNYKKSKKIYLDLKSVGPVYSWHSSKRISRILLDEEGKETALKNLEKEFKKLLQPDPQHYYELANFYKDNEYFEKSIKYYSIALNKIKENHFLIPKILDRRGTSYERIGDWENAEQDLLESLRIIPDQAHVLNYLAYTWIDKGINLDRGLKMLKKANSIQKEDGYIIDSLGWAYYAKKNYLQAESYLQRAVELMPSDPVINDHYADTLWMLNKNIQARYIWSYILKLDKTEKELKEAINKKLVFGIDKKL